MNQQFRWFCAESPVVNKGQVTQLVNLLRVSSKAEVACRINRGKGTTAALPTPSLLGNLLLPEKQIPETQKHGSKHREQSECCPASKCWPQQRRQATRTVDERTSRWTARHVVNGHMAAATTAFRLQRHRQTWSSKTWHSQGGHKYT